MKLIKRVLAFAAIAALPFFALSVASCDNDTDVGDAMENAADDAGDAMDNAADEADDAMDEAGDKMEDATDGR